MHSLGRTTPAVISSFAPVAEQNQPSALKCNSGSFSSHSSTNNGNPAQTLPRYVLTGKRAADVIQTQLQPLATCQAAAIQAHALGQGNALLHDSDCNPADKKKQKLAKNRATAALSRERKKAHLDVLQQRVSLLEKTNSSLSEQLALRESEVLQLKSRLGDIADTAQKTTHVPVPEAEKVIPPHTVLNAVSALPRIYCSVANPPSSSYPHQPNQAPVPPPSASPASDATEEEQLECKLEHSMSCDMPYQPVTIKPELQEPVCQGRQTQHAVITSGHFHVFSTAKVKSICQPQPLTTSTSLQHTDTTTEQHTSMAFATDQLAGHMPHAEHNLAAFKQHSVSCSQDWVPSSYDVGSYMYQDVGNGLQDTAGICQEQGAFLPGKAFNEQELLAWHLLSPEQMQSGAYIAPEHGMTFVMDQSKPQGSEVGEADVMVRHHSSSSTPSLQDWDASQVKSGSTIKVAVTPEQPHTAGQQQGLELEDATVHGMSWLPQQLDQQTAGSELDPTSRIFDELEHLEPQVLGPQATGIPCAV